MTARRTDAEILLEIHLGELGWLFTREHKFHPQRAWRFDYLIWPGRLSVDGARDVIEIEGGIFSLGRGGAPGQGRHNRPGGYLKDMEKYREAAALGYKVYRFSPQEVLQGVALEFLKRAVSCQHSALSQGAR